MKEPQQEHRENEGSEDFTNAVITITYNQQFTVTGDPEAATNALGKLLKQLEQNGSKALQAGADTEVLNLSTELEPPRQRRLDIDAEGINRADRGLSRSKQRNAKASAVGENDSYEDRLCRQRERIREAVSPWIDCAHRGVGVACECVLKVTKVGGAIRVLLKFFGY